jgi:hypothetical protein
MLAQCTGCGDQRCVPHSCGHRACPHCQAHDSQVWLQRQLQSLVPATYFLLTFTLPSELRGLAFGHQRVVFLENVGRGEEGVVVGADHFDDVEGGQFVVNRRSGDRGFRQQGEDGQGRHRSGREPAQGAGEPRRTGGARSNLPHDLTGEEGRGGRARGAAEQVPEFPVVLVHAG